MRALCLTFAGLALTGSGCTCLRIEPPVTTGLTSFDVRVSAINLPGTQTPLPVVTSCSKKYGSDALVPAEVRGTKACKYQMPRAEVDVQISATALDHEGKVMPDFFGPVTFRAVPGDLTGVYRERWAQAHSGKAELANLKVAHLFGEVRFWAEDAPPALMFDGGAPMVNTEELPVEPELRTYATGLSPPSSSRTRPFRRSRCRTATTTARRRWSASSSPSARTRRAARRSSRAARTTR